MAAYLPLRVNPQTIKQIEQLSQSNDCSAREILQVAISAAWSKQYNPPTPPTPPNAEEIKEPLVVLSEEPSINDEVILPVVYPKPEHRKYLETLTDCKGPYQILRLNTSWAGYSDGVYQLDGCPVPVPVSWFKSTKPEKQPLVVTTPAFFITWIVVQVILQLGFFCMFML